jgi:hypothetical protein
LIAPVEHATAFGAGDYVPSVIEKGAVRAIAPDQQISLLSESFTSGDYLFKEAGKIKPGTFGFMEATIPVVLDVFYSVAGVSAQRRGLYYLTVNMIINDNDTRAKVPFEDFAFVQELQDDADIRRSLTTCSPSTKSNEIILTPSERPAGERATSYKRGQFTG